MFDKVKTITSNETFTQPRIQIAVLITYMFWRYTDSIKINRPGHNIHIYWTNFWRSTIYVQQNIFESTLIEVCSLHPHAFFGTFCAQIGQLFETQWVFGPIYLQTIPIPVQTPRTNEDEYAKTPFQHPPPTRLEGKVNYTSKGNVVDFGSLPKCSKTRCAVTNWPILTQNVPKEA